MTYAGPYLWKKFLTKNELNELQNPPKRDKDFMKNILKRYPQK